MFFNMKIIGYTPYSRENEVRQSNFEKKQNIQFKRTWVVYHYSKILKHALAYYTSLKWAQCLESAMESEFAMISMRGAIERAHWMRLRNDRAAEIFLDFGCRGENVTRGWE